MNRCIVVIEDEPAILQVLQDVLELEHFNVLGITQPQLVRSAIRGLEPDLFLIDIMLPQMSGIELAQELRDQGFATTPMIAMSASKLMAKIAQDSGLFQGAIDKPFDLPTLLEYGGEQAPRSVSQKS